MMNETYVGVSEFLEDEYPEANNIALCGSSFMGKGGASRVIQQQAKELSGRGYNVTIVALEADMSPPPDVDLKIVGKPQSGISGRISRLIWPISPSIVKSIRFLSKMDVVICHRYPLTVAGYIVKNVFGVGYVYWFHHVVDSSRFSGLAKSWIRILKYLEIRNRTAVNADYVVSVSESSKDKIEKNSPSKNLVVENRADVSRFSDSYTKEEAEQWLSENSNYSESEQIILFVGRLSPQKNVHKLIEIFNDIGDNIGNVKLVLVGSESDPKYVESLKSLASDNVIFIGYVSDQHLGGLYKISDVLATCSESESWYLPAEEADYFNLPVVAFDDVDAARAISTNYLTKTGDYEKFTNNLRQVLNL